MSRWENVLVEANGVACLKGAMEEILWDTMELPKDIPQTYNLHNKGKEANMVL